jgi:hypothetical protein
LKQVNQVGFFHHCSTQSVETGKSERLISGLSFSLGMKIPHFGNLHEAEFKHLAPHITIIYYPSLEKML